MINIKLFFFMKPTCKTKLAYTYLISNNHLACGTFKIDYEEGLITRRSSGGTAILWHKDLPATVIKNCDNTIIGLKLTVDNTFLRLVNAYLPFCKASNRDAFLEYLGGLKTMCEELVCPNICILGDFNACRGNALGKL